MKRSERASERWLRERIDETESYGASMLGSLRVTYTSELARIDTAEARFEACSDIAKTEAGSFVHPKLDLWHKYPMVVEALADVAEGIDARASCPHCEKWEPHNECSTYTRAAGGVTDTERLDWLEGQRDSYAGPQAYAFPVTDPESKLWFIYSNDDTMDVLEQPTLRAAIDSAMRREREKGVERD